MSDIYNILAKYFAGETSSEEEQQVRQFKLDNPEEYRALRAFWTTKGTKLSKFNTDQAWEKIAKKSNRPKRVFLLSSLRRVAAVAAIFVLAVTGIYLYNNINTSPAIIQMTASIQKDTVELDDGTIVYLNNKASFSFPEEFDSHKREVTLEGEAFFEVAEDSKRPFIVYTNHSDVTVLGTTFNINTLEEETEVSVATGKVQVKSIINSETSILTPNQAARVTSQGMEVFSTENNNYVAWKTGVFHFDESMLQQVVEDLNSYYGNRIKLIKQDADCLFSSTFNQRDLKEIMEIIQLSCDLQLNQKNGYYELH